MFGERRVARALDGGASRILGRVRVAGTGAAAVYEYEAGNALGVVGRNEEPVRFQYHARTHAVAYEDAAFQLEVVHQRGDVAAIVGDGAFVRTPRRLAVAAQVARDDFVGRRKETELSLPVFQRAGEAVDEDERGSAPPGSDEIHRTTLPLLFGLCGPVGRRELLLELRRRRFVVAEFHAVGAVPGGQRFQPRREMLELGKRRLRRDLDGPGTRRIGALDLAAVPGELARDVAHLRLRRDDLDVHDRLEHDRARFAQGVQERLAPGGDESDLLRVDRVALAVVHDHPHVLQRVAGDVAALQDAAHAFLHRGDELVRDRPALHAVDELEARAPRQRLDLEE